MNRDKRDLRILRKIVDYCDRVDGAKERFGNSIEALRADVFYQDAVAMSVLQIGELTSHLSEDFRLSHKNVPWRAIKNMRNIAAHNYENFGLKFLWSSMDEDIPALREYCKRIIEQTMTTDKQ